MTLDWLPVMFKREVRTHLGIELLLLPPQCYVMDIINMYYFLIAKTVAFRVSTDILVYHIFELECYIGITALISGILIVNNGE